MVAPNMFQSIPVGTCFYGSNSLVRLVMSHLLHFEKWTSNKTAWFSVQLASPVRTFMLLFLICNHSIDIIQFKTSYCSVITRTTAGATCDFERLHNLSEVMQTFKIAKLGDIAMSIFRF